MKSVRYLLCGAAIVGAAAFAGCDGPSNASKIEESLNKIVEKQDAILAKIEELGKKGPAGPAGPQPGRPDPKAAYKATVDDAHAKGPSDAKVTIVEWSDFQCPFCSRVGPTIKKIEEEYKDDVRIAFKHNPLGFHDRAMPAALAAEAAGKQGKFWEMHDKLFENQKELTDENFAKWAKELGLDTKQFEADMKDEALKKKVEKQQQQGNTLGARGTPAFFVNGRFVSGAQPFESFKALIDEEIKKADKFISEGTPKDKVYDKIMEKALAKL